MSTRKIAAFAVCLVIFISGPSTPAKGKGTNAFCEMRSGGETKKGQTGDCKVTGKEGTVTIELANGVTYTLKSTNVKSQYKDQNGAKVVHMVTEKGKEEVYKWENRRLVVTWR